MTSTGETSCTLRYWAAAKEAAGTSDEPCTGGTLADVLAAAVRAHGGERAALAKVLTRCSFLVDGTPVGTREHDTVRLPAGAVVEVLPPFAGG
jgi:molybdopterin synthase sulfur carrier subunit